MPGYPPRLIPAGSSVKLDILGKAVRGEKQLEEQQSEGKHFIEQVFECVGSRRENKGWAGE